MKSIVIIAKGPSAIDADKFIMHGDHIAVINDAGRLIPEKKYKNIFLN